MIYPSSWKSVALGSVAEEVRVAVTPKPGTTYELYSVPTFASGAPEVLDGSAIGSAKRIVQPGDVLLCKINPRINRVWIVGEPLSGAMQIASPEYLILRASSRELSSYLRWYLSSPRFREWIAMSVEGATGSHTRAKSGPILRQLVPLPPLAEQQRIVETIEEQFSRVDAANAAIDAVNRRLAAFRAALLRRATDGWGERRLGGIGKVFVGTTPSRRVPELWSGDIPWVSSGEVAFCRIRQTRETISHAAVLSPERIHPPGTVLLAMIGEGKTRGQAAILDVAATHNQNSAAIRLDRAVCSPEWLFYVLMARYESTRRAGSGAQQPALNKSRVEALSIPLPPLSDQARIVTDLDRALSLADSLASYTARSLVKSSGLRRSILASAFGGTLGSQEKTDQPANGLVESDRAVHGLEGQRQKVRA